MSERMKAIAVALLYMNTSIVAADVFMYINHFGGLL